MATGDSSTSGISTEPESGYYAGWVLSNLHKKTLVKKSTVLMATVSAMRGESIQHPDNEFLTEEMKRSNFTGTHSAAECWVRQTCDTCPCARAGVKPPVMAFLVQLIRHMHSMNSATWIFQHHDKAYQEWLHVMRTSLPLWHAWCDMLHLVGAPCCPDLGCLSAMKSTSPSDPAIRDLQEQQRQLQGVYVEKFLHAHHKTLMRKEKLMAETSTASQGLREKLRGFDVKAPPIPVEKQGEEVLLVVECKGKHGHFSMAAYLPKARDTRAPACIFPTGEDGGRAKDMVTPSCFERDHCGCTSAKWKTGIEVWLQQGEQWEKQLLWKHISAVTSEA